MLNKSTIDEINAALQQGQIAAALAPLQEVIDLRWNELPRVGKTTLTALAGHLRQDKNVAPSFAEAFFHSNISVRRFARKFVQSLKAEAAPLARPLRARIEAFLCEARALPYSFQRDEAARRREQADVLEGAIESLRRCDVNELLDCLEDLSKVWHPVLHERQQRLAQRWKDMEPLQQQMQHRTQEVFDEKFGQLKLTMSQVFAVPRLQREYRQAQGSDPILTDLRAQIQALNATLLEPEQTLMEEVGTARQMLVGEIDNVVRRKAKPGEETNRVRARLWKWIEDGLRGDNPAIESAIGHSYYWTQWFDHQTVREQALPLLAEAKTKGLTSSLLWSGLLRSLNLVASPYVLEQDGVTALPASLTSDTVRALKTGVDWQDNMIEGIAQAIEEWQAKQMPETPEPSTPPLRGYADSSAHAQSLQEFVAKLVTPQERAEALVNPPIIELDRPTHATIELMPISRQQLLHEWSQRPDWPETKIAMAEVVLPRLWQRFTQQCEAYQKLHKRGSALELDESASATLTQRELSALRSATREQESWKALRELTDVYVVIIELGGSGQQPAVLDALEGRGLEDVQDIYINWVLAQLGHHQPADASALPFVAELHARWKRNQERKPRRAGHRNSGTVDWRTQGHFDGLTYVLYRIGTPESIIQSREAFEKAGPGSFFYMAQLAKERRDYDMLLPLVRHVHWATPDLIAFWDDLRQAEPERVPIIAGELLEMLAAATEENGASLPLQLLASLDGQAELWVEHATAIARLLESTLPTVLRFAFARPSSLLDEALDWPHLSSIAGEKLWSEKPGLAKDAAKFLGQVGARHADAAPVAWQALCDALSLQSLPLLELVLRALGQIKAKQDVALEDAVRERIEELGNDAPRLSRLCERLLQSN